MLLQYTLGSPKSFAWVVTRTSLQLVELADRATIESAARRVYENLKTYRSGRVERRAGPRSSPILSALVLAPIVPFLSSDKQRLIVAADGALGYIPFGVLPLTRGVERTSLLEVVEVSNVPSMSAVVAQRRRVERAPPKTLAVFADPCLPRRIRASSRATTLRPLPGSPRCVLR